MLFLFVFLVFKVFKSGLIVQSALRFKCSMWFCSNCSRMSKVFNVFKLPSVIQTVIQGVQGVLVQNIQIGLSVFSVQEQSECLRR